MYKAAAGRTGGRHAIGHTSVGQAEYIASQLLNKLPRDYCLEELNQLRKLRSRVTLRLFSWELPGAHSYRSAV